MFVLLARLVGGGRLSCRRPCQRPPAACGCVEC